MKRRIKIQDLTQEMELTKKEMRKVNGGVVPMTMPRPGQIGLVPMPFPMPIRVGVFPLPMP